MKKEMGATTHRVQMMRRQLMHFAWLRNILRTTRRLKQDAKLHVAKERSSSLSYFPPVWIAGKPAKKGSFELVPVLPTRTACSCYASALPSCTCLAKS